MISKAGADVVRTITSYKESAASPIIKAREYVQYHISFFHTFSHLRNLKQCVHRGVTTPQVQQRVWSDQQN